MYRSMPDEERGSEVAASPVSRRVVLLLASLAGLCWAGALAMLIWGVVDRHQPYDAPERMVYYIIVVAAALLTFVPVERQLHLTGLALEGVAGTALLLYTLAFVPPPTGWLLSPPDAPVYGVMALATFWFFASLAMPLLYAAGQRLFKQRARRYDRRRARRQAYEIGWLAALIIILAGLRTLTPVAVVLVALIIGVVELLFLSFVEPES
ncbi:hypothetical protein [Roseiflexus sp.]|uniref:hypothetical protein n=1 Tax=Roseiflexus sp. TaxID=2562120 RepID=UPI00398B45C2